MNKSAIFMFLLTFSAFFRLPICHAENNSTWYFRTDYGLSQIQTETANNVYISRSGTWTGFLGVRVFVNETEITNGVSAIVSRTTSGSGFQTGQLSVSHHLIFGSNVVIVKVYMRLGIDQDWIQKAEFTTEKLFFSYINGEWGFHFYTDLQFVSDTTLWFFYFGNEIYNSRIEGVSLTEPTLYDWMFYHLRTGNFIGFIIYPFVNLIGNLFYGLIVILICMPLYIRYRNITVILFIITLLGGAGGMISLLIPESGLGVAWLIFVFGLAGLIYKVFR